jgi:cell division septation protein DedD
MMIACDIVLLPPEHISDKVVQLNRRLVEEGREDILKKHGLADIKVDNYAEIRGEVESIPIETPSPAKVAESVENYLKTGEEKPTDSVPANLPTPTQSISSNPKNSSVPSDEPSAALDFESSDNSAPTETAETQITSKPPAENIDKELEALNAQAEKLRKLLLKEK